MASKHQKKGPDPILIVGAGPVGLLLALWFTKLGTPYRHIERSGGVGEQSRAIIVQSRPLELLRTLGLSDAMVATGRPVMALTVRREGKARGGLRMGHWGKDISPFPFALAIPQDAHERVLLEHLAGLGGKVEWQTELVRVEDGADGARVLLRRGDGTEEWSAHSYVAGCDGARSLVREQAGIRLEGGTYPQRYFVADVEARGEAVSGNMNLCFADPHFGICLPLPAPGTARLIGMLNHPRADDFAFEDCRPGVVAAMGIDVTKVKWFTVYKVHHRVASAFRAGRTFLLGDACHLHSPIGGQGMNAGLGDACNLAWKMDAVLRGTAPPQLLDTYEPERRSFAKILVKTTDRMFTLVASQTWIGKFMRKVFVPYIVPIVMSVPFMARNIFYKVSQCAVAYPTSALSSGKLGKMQAGERLPWVRFEDGSDNQEPTGHLGWQLHVYGTAPPMIKKMELDGVMLRVFPWAKEVAAKGLKKDAIYLLRPDGHVGLVSESVDDLEEYLSHWVKSRAW